MLSEVSDELPSFLFEDSVELSPSPSPAIFMRSLEDQHSSLIHSIRAERSHDQGINKQSKKEKSTSKKEKSMSRTTEKKVIVRKIKSGKHSNVVVVSRNKKDRVRSRTLDKSTFSMLEVDSSIDVNDTTIIASASASYNRSIVSREEILESNSIIEYGANRHRIQSIKQAARHSPQSPSMSLRRELHLTERGTNARPTPSSLSHRIVLGEDAKVMELLDDRTRAVHDMRSAALLLPTTSPDHMQRYRGRRHKRRGTANPVGGQLRGSVDELDLGPGRISPRLASLAVSPHASPRDILTFHALSIETGSLSAEDLADRLAGLGGGDGGVGVGVGVGVGGDGRGGESMYHYCPPPTTTAPGSHVAAALKQDGELGLAVEAGLSMKDVVGGVEGVYGGVGGSGIGHRPGSTPTVTSDLYARLLTVNADEPLPTIDYLSCVQDIYRLPPPTQASPSGKPPGGGAFSPSTSPTQDTGAGYASPRGRMSSTRAARRPNWFKGEGKGEEEVKVREKEKEREKEEKGEKGEKVSMKDRKGRGPGRG